VDENGTSQLFFSLCLGPKFGKNKLVEVTESQNHRMLGVGRDLCGSSSPTPLPKQGLLQQAAQELVQVCTGPCPHPVAHF